MKLLKVASMLLVLVSTQLFALNAQEERYIRIINQEGVRGIKEASQSIYKTREDNPEVLDQLAEQLLKRHRTATSYDIDALAWATKALAQSGNRRYYDALHSIAEGDGPKKLRKYAKKAYRQLKEPEGEQYKLGMAAAPGNKKQSAKKSSKAGKKSGKGSFDDIVNGMSMDEVTDLIGAPDSMQVYQTGKDWVPFNFKGGDTVRQEAIYEGRGRIIYSNTDRYSGSYIVSEVIPQ